MVPLSAKFIHPNNTRKKKEDPIPLCHLISVDQNHHQTLPSCYLQWLLHAVRSKLNVCYVNTYLFSRYMNLVVVIIFSVAYIETRNRFISLCGQHSPIFWNIESASVRIKGIGRAAVGKIICAATHWCHNCVIPLKIKRKIQELNHPVVAKIQQVQY
jgi:hypothetical protein